MLMMRSLLDWRWKVFLRLTWRGWRPSYVKTCAVRRCVGNASRKRAASNVRWEDPHEVVVNWGEDASTVGTVN